MDRQKLYDLKKKKKKLIKEKEFLKKMIEISNEISELEKEVKEQRAINGLNRQLDELGRIVIPKDIRDILKLENNDVIEFKLLNDKILLKKVVKK